MSDKTKLMQDNLIKDFEAYLNNIHPSPDRNIVKVFLDAFSAYIGFFGEIIPVVEHGGHVYSKNLQDKFNHEIDKFLVTAEDLERSLPLPSRIKTRNYFRSTIERYLFRSQILKRFYDKPRGYAGDYFMFEIMYDAKTLSSGIGAYFDNYVFTHSLVVSVANRKEKMKKELANTLSYDMKNSAELKILNIGCGGAREVKELFSENTFPQGINFTLMDQDEEALSYAKSQLNTIKNIDFNFIQKNALEMIGFSKGIPHVDSYDIIYTLGIVDYFLDNVFSRFIKYCHGLLKPNGKLIIAVCSNQNLTCYTALRWLCEWNFYYRDVDSINSLIKDIIDNPKIEITWEQRKQIFFITIKK